MKATLNTAPDSVPAAEDAEASWIRRRRDAMVASWQGYYLDFIDIFAPVIALAPALAFFSGPEMSSADKTMIFYLSFFATLIGRPLGSLIFGTIADRLGRRRITLISVAGFTVCTLAIGLLPGYQSVGMLSPVLLVVLRFVDGIFLGGEYTSATPMAFEYVNKNRRGLFGGVLQGAYPAAYVTVSVVTLVVFAFLPPGGLDSPYVQWGWRIVFIMSGVASAAFFIYRYRHLPESETWLKTKKVRAPLRQVLFGDDRRDFWQTFTLMSGMWFVSAATVSVIPSILTDTYGFSSAVTTWTLLITHLAVAVVFVLVGALSQVTGRRPMIVGLGVVVGTVSATLWGVFASGVVTSPIAVAVLVCLTAVTAIAPFGISTTYCNERFPTAVRSTGFGVAYSLSIVIPSLFPFYSLLVGALIPVVYTTAVCYVLAGLLMVVGALWGPETREVELGTAPSARKLDYIATTSDLATVNSMELEDNS